MALGALVEDPFDRCMSSLNGLGACCVGRGTTNLRGLDVYCVGLDVHSLGGGFANLGIGRGFPDLGFTNLRNMYME